MEEEIKRLLRLQGSGMLRACTLGTAGQLHIWTRGSWDSMSRTCAGPGQQNSSTESEAAANTDPRLRKGWQLAAHGGGMIRFLWPSSESNTSKNICVAQTELDESKEEIKYIVKYLVKWRQIWVELGKEHIWSNIYNTKILKELFEIRKKD